LSPVNTVALREWLRQERGLDLADYEALRRWSVEHLADFWQAMWDHFDLQSPTPWSAVLSGPQMPGARWFEGASLNYAAQVARHVPASAAVPALVFRNERLQREGSQPVEIGWAELMDQAAALAATLQSLGVQPGDRVAPTCRTFPQAAVAFLACASIGAIWSLTAPDMGVGTVRDRFRQIEPKVLIACDGTVYGGKVADRRDTVAALLRELPSVHTLLLVPYLERGRSARSAFRVPARRLVRPRAGPGPRRWPRASASRRSRCPSTTRCGSSTAAAPPACPSPSCTGMAGVVLEMLKLHAFHLDLRPSRARSDERFHWYSSTGWVMWNLALSVAAARHHGVPVRRPPVVPRARHAVALCRCRAGHLPRCRRGLLRRLPEGRVSSRAGSDSAPACARLHRVAAGARGLRPGPGSRCGPTSGGR
jgi:acetoacetyl-CoA synthetase